MRRGPPSGKGDVERLDDLGPIRLDNRAAH